MIQQKFRQICTHGVRACTTTKNQTIQLVVFAGLRNGSKVGRFQGLRGSIMREVMMGFLLVVELVAVLVIVQDGCLCDYASSYASS